MVWVRSRSLLVWMALFCSLLLPMAAAGEMRAPHQLEAISCGMSDCHCDCCPLGAARFSGCQGCSGSLSSLAPSGSMVLDLQVSPHRLGQITPVFKALTADIFHPPELCLS